MAIDHILKLLYNTQAETLKPEEKFVVTFPTSTKSSTPSKLREYSHLPYHCRHQAKIHEKYFCYFTVMRVIYLALRGFARVRGKIEWINAKAITKA